jgi:ornithine carbamoyltransferase
MQKLKIVRPGETESAPVLATRHLISLHDLTRPQIEGLLRLAQEVKAEPARYSTALAGQRLAMLTEIPGMRSRVTFELAFGDLGGRALALGPEESGLRKREAVKDVARNLSRWVDIIVARAHSHHTTMELAEYSTVPVINALSDFEHPCQALADYLTLLERHGRLTGLTLAWVGDGNHVTHSLIYGAARLGVHMRIATPAGYEPDRSVVAEAKREGGDVTLTHDPAGAVAGADAVYTDVWTSREEQEGGEKIQEIFLPYQVNAQLMRTAGANAVFMHCQPARRGEEVTDDVLDSPRSLAYDQSENRLHMQKAIFLSLLA